MLIKKKISYIQYWDVNDLYGLVVSQKAPVKKTIAKKVMKGIFLMLYI